ncbi:hypothetical protein M9H77_07829 [Catharanthus roseus]|uniref:Uncharacterized protein n=1 Tax=Catharanthus roseus TaxID=4058 RepID=A0ACC0BW10_CATRO|nr:hypothetical protein M9H77_07829 [Catharanthus roseus]
MKNVVHFIFGIFGNISSFFLCLSPIITFKRIIKKRSTEYFSGIPYSVALLNCLLSAWYGLPFVSPNNLLFATINGTAVVFCSIYVLIFILFANKREKFKILGLLILELSLFSSVVLVSILALHGHKRMLFCGLASTILSVIMYASPLTIIRLVIKTKSVEFMPFFLSLSAFLCGTSWFVFGLIGSDPFIFVRNGIGCGLGLVQLILYAVYHKNKGSPKEETTDDGSVEKGQMNGKVEEQEKQTSIHHPKQNDEV